MNTYRKTILLRFVLLTVIVGLTASSAYAATSRSWKELNEYADTLNVEQALAELEKSPGAFEALYITGVVYLNAYDYQQAEGYFEQMLAKDPKSLLGLWGIAECRRRAYAFDEAQKMLKRIIARDPEFAPAYISLGYIQYLKTGFQEAAATVSAVIRLGPGQVDLNNYVRAHSLYAGAKGMIAHYSGPFSKAVNGAAVLRHLRIARNLAPDSASVLFGYGSYYLLIPPILGRDAEKAIDLLKQSIEKDPLFVDAYVRLAQAYKLNGDLQQYTEYLDKALELDPQNIVALDIKNGVCRFICVDITD